MLEGEWHIEHVIRLSGVVYKILDAFALICGRNHNKGVFFLQT